MFRPHNAASLGSPNGARFGLPNQRRTRVHWDSQNFAKRLRLARESYRPHGRPWSMATVAKMADYYGVSMGWLVGVTTEGGPSLPDYNGGESSEPQQVLSRDPSPGRVHEVKSLARN